MSPKPAGAGEPPKSLSLGKRVLFSAILAVLVLGTLELAAQVYLRSARGYAGREFLQYQFDPYKNIHPTRNWEDTRGVRHNVQGFRRDEDIAEAKPEGTFRVFLMGASTAYGTGGLWPHLQRDFEVIDNSETIDAYLEGMLNESLPYERVEVINVAIPSIQTHHHLIYLNQTILRYEPDLVLFLDGLNDHYYYERDHDQFSDYSYKEQSNSIMGPATLSSLVRMNGWWLFRKSAFAHVAIRAGRGLATVVRGAPQPAPIDVAQALEDLRYTFDRNALSMIERSAVILEHEGVPAIFMLQPMLLLERDHLDRMPPIERRLFEFDVASNSLGMEEYSLAAVHIVAGMIEEAVLPTGAAFLDLTDIYDESEGQIFTDYAHLTPEGNRILAEHVHRKILQVLESPSDSVAARP